MGADRARAYAAWAPLGRDVAALERAGLRLDTLRELGAGGWDPLSLALRAVR